MVWSGKGIFSALVLLIAFGLFLSIIPKEQVDYAFVLSFFIAAAFSWVMGKKWNNQEVRTIVDKATGEEVLLNADHTLFWIDMQYWAFIYGAIGIIILGEQFLN